MIARQRSAKEVGISYLVCSIVLGFIFALVFAGVHTGMGGTADQLAFVYLLAFLASFLFVGIVVMLILFHEKCCE